MTRHYPRRVSPFGHLRIIAWLAAPRSLSQLATSFIASRHLGIRRTPFLAWSPDPLTPARHRMRGCGRRPRSSLASRTLEYARLGRRCGCRPRLPPTAPGHRTKHPEGSFAPSLQIRSGYRPRPCRLAWHREGLPPNAAAGRKGGCTNLGLLECIHICCDRAFSLRIQFSKNVRSPKGNLVELDGIEPTTPCLQSRCSTN